MPGGDLEVGAIVVGSPVPQAAAGVPGFGRLDDPDFFEEREHAEERVSPLATELAEVPHRRAEEILQLRKPFVDGGQWLEESEIHLSFGKFWGREGPFNPRRRRIEMPCTSLAGLDEVAQMPPAFLQQGVHRATPSGSARATTSF